MSDVSTSCAEVIFWKSLDSEDNLRRACRNIRQYIYLINQARGPYWENIGPRSWQYGPSAARSVQKRPRADILPVRPSRLVNKIYLARQRKRPLRTMRAPRMPKYGQIRTKSGLFCTPFRCNLLLNRPSNSSSSQYFIALDDHEIPSRYVRS